jgi:hypothetical protein
LPPSLYLSFDHLEADVRLLARALQHALAPELETDGADEVARHIVDGLSGDRRAEDESKMQHVW